MAELLMRAVALAWWLWASVASAADIVVDLHQGADVTQADRLDNMARLRAAAALTGSGDVLVFPSGTFEVEVSPNDLQPVGTGLSVVLGLRLTGQSLRGSSSTLRFYPDTVTFQYAAIYYDAYLQSQKVKISGLDIVGPQTPNSPYDENASNTAGIWWQGALAPAPDALTLENMHINGGRWFTGVFASNGGALSLSHVDLSSLIDGIGWFGATRSDLALTVTDSRIHDCGIPDRDGGMGPKGDLIYVHPNAALSISNSSFAGTYRYAIYQNGSPTAAPPVCRFSGITVEPSCAYSIQTATAGSCTVTGSKISAMSRGIWARNDLVVVGNEFHYRGINSSVGNLKNAVVSGNSFYLDDPLYSGGMIQADAAGARWTVTGNTIIGMQTYPNMYAQATAFFAQSGAGADSRLSGNVSNGLYTSFANIRAGMSHVNDNTIVGARFALYLTATPTLIEFKDNYTNVLSAVASFSAQTPPSVLFATDNLNMGAQ